MTHSIARQAKMIITLLVSLFIVFGVVPNGAQAAIISTQGEIDIGRDVGKQLEKQYGLVGDPALEERVTKIGMNMVAVSERRNLPYTFKVLNSNEVNALAAPGGFIYLFKGLVDLMPSDDELAGVIGHEIGHVVKRHTVHQIEKNLLMNVGFMAVFGDRGIALQSLAMDVIMAGYSRSDEREADYLGYIHSSKAGYNPYSMTMGLMKLSSLDQHYQYDLFSDHPEGKERIALIQGYLEKDHVHPKAQLTADKKGAIVVDGTWKLPTITVLYNGVTPLYRAYETAGALYRVSQLAEYNPDTYILDYDGENIVINYNDIRILVITPEDALAYNTNQMELAGLYVDKLKEWDRKKL